MGRQVFGSFQRGSVWSGSPMSTCSISCGIGVSSTHGTGGWPASQESNQAIDLTPDRIDLHRQQVRLLERAQGTTPETLEKDAVLYPVRRPVVLMPQAPLGIRGKAFQGESYFTAPNPPAGAVFTYFLKDELKNLKKTRQQREKELVQQGKEPEYPTPAQFRAEARDEDPQIVLTVSDVDGKVVRRVVGPATAGLHRVSWDLRYPPSTPVNS